MMEDAYIKDAFNSIKTKWKYDGELTDGYATKIDIEYIDENGDKQIQDYVLCSVKYKGKWYSVNCMEAVAGAIWGYTPPRS